jgi:DNA-binding response OmpR family regulator
MKKIILVVDDELSIRLLLENYLGKEFKVVSKKDGLEGIKYLEEGNLPDIVVADIQMPNMDGYQFLENTKISGFFNKVPIIMLSGNESSQERIKSLKMGADDYMVKPFNPEELSLRIKNILARMCK